MYQKLKSEIFFTDESKIGLGVFIHNYISFYIINRPTRKLENSTQLQEELIIIVLVNLYF